MGWPRGNDNGARLYQENLDKSFILVITENGLDSKGCHDCVANAIQGPNPNLCGTSASIGYLMGRCHRVEWSELPDNWKREFLWWIREWDTPKPADDSRVLEDRQSTPGEF